MNAVRFNNRSQILTMVFMAFLLLSPLAATAGQSPLKGLVINQTDSYKAQNFYQAFCLAWHEQRNAGQFNVVLKEVHSPRHGRQVQVVYDRQVAYVASIPTGSAQIHSLAEQAAANVIHQIQNMVVQEATYRNPDLAVDEI